MPGIAPAAKQMGHYVGKLIAARVAGRPGAAPFRYLHPGELATIGRRAAVVKLGRLQLNGFIGWLFWSVAHIYFLIGLRNRFIVALHLAVELSDLPARRAADHVDRSAAAKIRAGFQRERTVVKQNKSRQFF